MSLIESLMSWKADKFSKISQVYFRAARVKQRTEVINWLSSAPLDKGSAEAVIDVTFVKIRSWSVVVKEKFILATPYGEVSVARYH